MGRVAAFRSCGPPIWLAALVMVSGAGASCATSAEPGDELVVSAASSLTDAFAELAERFESSHPGIDVVLNLDSSSTLATQAASGAPVDVFASADMSNMDEVVDEGIVVGAPVELATNTLVMVARADDSTVLGDLGDLETVTTEGEVVALCAATAPCGRLADDVLAAVGVDLPENRVTRAPNARGTLGAVTRGDAAAALVYASDALAAGSDVSVVPLAAADSAFTTYYVAALESGGGDPEMAAAFVDLVTSPEGAQVLAGQGFG